jgi:hypothetical protein
MNHILLLNAQRMHPEKEEKKREGIKKDEKKLFEKHTT